MANAKKIKILPKGPYEVDPDIPLSQATIESNKNGESIGWGQGRNYETPQGEPYHLCRCGHSKNKPFCDGTHNHVTFQVEETADNVPYDEQAKRYIGDTVDLLDAEAYCAVARFCDVGESCWAYAAASSVPGYEAAAIEEACNCPSGRLTIQRKDGEKVEPDLPQEVCLVQDSAEGRRGPLWVKGGIEVEGQDGTVYEVRNRMTLCRCGESGNMPFCDASHLQCDHMKGLDG